jgi:ferrochelatase
MKTAILITNLGTPSAPTTKAVRAYLKEFLSDPYVVKQPRWLWLPILYGIILNTRPKKSAKKYAAIWTEQGSPLLHYSQKITEKLQAALPNTLVKLAMRYGTPSLKQALAEFKQAGVEQLFVLPLYPQFSFSTTQSTLATLEKLLKGSSITMQWLKDYHDQPLYIQALAQSVRNFWRQHGRAQKLILSFHGLPQSMIKQGDPYFEQCNKSAQLLAQQLNLTPEDYAVTFQSRVGFEPWLEPYTDKSIIALVQQGIKHLQVLCPGFACDCLETLEEINIENRQAFLTAGGERFEYIPCLNDDLDLAKLLTQVVPT